MITQKKMRQNRRPPNLLDKKPNMNSASCIDLLTLNKGNGIKLISDNIFGINFVDVIVVLRLYGKKAGRGRKGEARKGREKAYV